MHSLPRTMENGLLACFWGFDCFKSLFVSRRVSSHVYNLHCPLKELAEVRILFNSCPLQESWSTQVHITNEQTSVLLACGEYWQHGHIPKDVFLDMLIGLLGARGKLDRLPREEQLALSCSLDEAEMVDVTRFVASLDLEPVLSLDLPQAESDEGHEMLQAITEEEGKDSARG
eukprot:737242-Amphidinium_carterae.1